MGIDSKSDRDRVRQLAARRKKVQEENRRIEKEMTANRREAGIRYVGSRSKDAEEGWKQQMAMMPRDTRDLTGRLMGDPIPGDPRRLLASGGKNDCKN